VADLGKKEGKNMATDPKLVERLRALWGESPKQPKATEPRPSYEHEVDGRAAPLSVGAEPPRRCPWHVDRSDWKDELAADRPGFIRTTCRKCGTWIGDRPAERSSPKVFDSERRI